MRSLEKISLPQSQQVDIGVETDMYLLNDLVERASLNANFAKAIETNIESSIMQGSLSDESVPENRNRIQSPFKSSLELRIPRGRQNVKNSISDDNLSGKTSKNGRKAVRGKHEKKIRFTDFACLLEAAWRGDLEEVSKLIKEKGLHPDTCNADGITPLHCAVALSHHEMTVFLVNAGANVNVADDHSWTPLHSAAFNNDRTTVELLTDHGADIEALDTQGQTPINLPTDISLIRFFGELVTMKNSNDWVTGLYDFDAGHVENGRGDELSFSRGDKLLVIDRADEDWWLAELADKQGYVPRQFVQ